MKRCRPAAAEHAKRMQERTVGSTALSPESPQEVTMGKSPGHRKWPDHKVDETRVGQGMEVVLDGTVVADSSDVIRVDEDKHPVRYYFARSDVRTDALEPSDTRTTCPFKGTARHFNLTVGGRKLEDAAWSYGDPYDEHRDLQGRLAFYDDRIPDLDVRTKI